MQSPADIPLVYREDTLFVPQRHHRIHAHRTPRRKIARRQRHHRQQNCHADKRNWIGCTYVEEQPAHQVSQAQRADHARCNADNLLLSLWTPAEQERELALDGSTQL